MTVYDLIGERAAGPETGVFPDGTGGTGGGCHGKMRSVSGAGPSVSPSVFRRAETAYQHCQGTGGQNWNLWSATKPYLRWTFPYEAQIINLLKDMQEDMGLTYLFISHDLSIVRFISDDVAVMYLGQIVEMGKQEADFDTPATLIPEALLSAALLLPEKKKRKKTGFFWRDLPAPYNPPAGCRFAGRCPYAREECREHVRVAEPEDGHGLCASARELA